MLSIGTVLTGLAAVSAAGMVLALGRRRLLPLTRPLLGGALCLDGIGLAIFLERLTGGGVWPSAGVSSATGLSMAGDTAVILFKLGWTVGFLAFLRRFAVPLGGRSIRRAEAGAIAAAAALLAAGWIEFLSTSRRGLMDNLQSASDYAVFFATIGAGLSLRSLSAGRVRPKGARAMVVLGGLSASFFLLLGAWWIAGGSLPGRAAARAAAFIPLMFTAFNSGLALWGVRFANVLAGSEGVRLVSVLVPEDGASSRGLSPREREIVALVGQGLTNQEIADRLFISLFTVKKHLNTVFTKTGVSNRVLLVRLFSGEGRDSAARPGLAPLRDD